MKSDLKIMSIQDLLRIPNLKSSFKHPIIFVPTNPNYFDFGFTRFLQLNIADTDAPIITNYVLERVSYFAKRECKSFETVYVCCDAGLSRSPAVALFLAYKLHDTVTACNIVKQYKFMNEELFKKLMEMK